MGGARSCRLGVAESVPGWAGARNRGLVRKMTAGIPYQPEATARGMGCETDADASGW